jgi:predicted enzyme related to lactoylglutathione lyase
MRIRLNSVLVNDQDKALAFYTEKLGFVKKTDIPMGEHRWITVVSPEERNGTELVLEPLSFEPARDYQKALYEAGIPMTAFQVDDVDAEHQQLRQKGVEFSMEPTDIGPARMAVLDDTCGNRIQVFQVR